MEATSTKTEAVDRRAGTLSVALRLLRLCGKGEARSSALGLALLFFSTAAALLQPWPMKLVIDSVIGSNPAPAFLSKSARAISASDPRVALLVLLCVAQLLLHVLIGALMVASTYVLVAVGLRMVFRLRCALFEKIQRLSLKFHDSTSVGDSIYRVAWDSYAVQAIFNSGLIPALTAAFTLIGIGTVLASRDWVVAVASVGVCVPLALLVGRLDRPMTESSMKVHERESEITTHVQEALTGIRAVQAFGRENYESERFRNQAQSSLRASLHLTVLQTASQTVVGLLLALATAILIGVCGYRVLHRRLSTGDIVLSVAYVVMLFRPLETLANTAAYIQGAVAGARRVLSILDTTPDVADEPGAIKLPGRARGELELRNVSFGYRPGQLALNDVSFQIPAGMTLALGGASGAGETDFVDVLVSFSGA